MNNNSKTFRKLHAHRRSLSKSVIQFNKSSVTYTRIAVLHIQNCVSIKNFRLSIKKSFNLKKIYRRPELITRSVKSSSHKHLTRLKTRTGFEDCTHSKRLSLLDLKTLSLNKTK